MGMIGMNSLGRRLRTSICYINGETIKSGRNERIPYSSIVHQDGRIGMLEGNGTSTGAGDIDRNT